MSERICECGGELLHGPRGFFCPSCAGLGAPDDPPDAAEADWHATPALAAERERLAADRDDDDDDDDN